MRKRDPSDVLMLQRAGFDSLSAADQRSYMLIQKKLRDHPFLQQSFSRKELGKVYEALNIDDPLFYVPNYTESGEDEYFYDPVSEYAERYWRFCRDIWESLEDEPEEPAEYLNEKIAYIAELYRKEYSVFLKNYCIAKAIQYMCNIYGIRCDLYSDRNGALYAGYIMGGTENAKKNSKPDPFGLVRSEKRLDEVIAPVVKYLDSRGYSYKINDVVPFERILKVIDENVLLQFNYLQIFDSFIIKAFITPGYKRKFIGDLEQEYIFLPGKLEGSLCWQTDYRMSQGTDYLMNKLSPFLPEGGLPEEISMQLKEFKEMLKNAKECFETGNHEELAELCDKTLEELMKLDDMCEKHGLNIAFTGNSYDEFRDLVMRIDKLDDESDEQEQK